MHLFETEHALPCASLPFFIPCEPDEVPLDVSERRILAQRLEAVEVKEIAGVVAADGLVGGELAIKLRDKSLEDYKDTVFRPSIFADPPRFFSRWSS